MSEFGLVKSFQIDNGELNGLTPQMCFVLGYELARIDDMIKHKTKIAIPVHVENKERIMDSFKGTNISYQLTWMNDDVSESWLWLEIV